jgi:hypothetical protein
MWPTRASVRRIGVALEQEPLDLCRGHHLHRRQGESSEQYYDMAREHAAQDEVIERFLCHIAPVRAHA